MLIIRLVVYVIFEVCEFFDQLCLGFDLLQCDFRSDVLVNRLVVCVTFSISCMLFSISRV